MSISKADREYSCGYSNGRGDAKDGLPYRESAMKLKKSVHWREGYADGFRMGQQDREDERLSLALENESRRVIRKDVGDE